MSAAAIVTEAIKKQLCQDEIDLSKPLSDYEGDSLDVLELVMNIEDELGIEITDDDIASKGDGITGADLVALADAAKAFSTRSAA
jgi:acyl carrier protein